MAKSKNPIIRVAGYCRTSGEGQRDNTSIPLQKEDIERFCKVHGFQLVGFYIDESKSGSKIEGRDEYQRMMGDARRGLFEGVVVYKIDRLHRAKINAQVEYLKSEIGVFTLDTAGYDNRSQHGIDKFLGNRFQEVFAEYERLQIMQRMIGGRIKKAKDGVRWAEPPRFREFICNRSRGVIG